MMTPYHWSVSIIINPYHCLFVQFRKGDGCWNWCLVQPLKVEYTSLHIENNAPPIMTGFKTGPRKTE